MLFSQLGLSAELLRAVDEKGYLEATPIQQQAIPLILGGHDVLAGAQTGTGKHIGLCQPLRPAILRPPEPPELPAWTESCAANLPPSSQASWSKHNNVI